MFNEQKVFNKDEKVRLKHTFIECIITDKFECSNPRYWVLINGEIFEKTENQLSYSVWKTIKNNFNDSMILCHIYYNKFFGSNTKQIKNSQLKIFIGIIIGLLLSHIFKF